jgi:hypothetical protein
MNLVEILTIDDATIPKEVFRGMNLSDYRSSEYSFYWSLATNKFPINADNYVKYISYFSGLEISGLGVFEQVRYKILIFDLGYNSTNVIMDEQKRSEIEKWVGTKYPSQTEDPTLYIAMDGIYLVIIHSPPTSGREIIVAN